MAKVYELVAWAGKGRVKLTRSEMNAYMRESIQEFDELDAKVRYETRFEIQDILDLSGAYERFGCRMLEFGRVLDAFFVFARAAECCCDSKSGWRYNDEYGSILCGPLRGWFFAMFSRCKEMLRDYPWLESSWKQTRLDRCMGYVTEFRRNVHAELAWFYREYEENWEYTKALRFGRDEVYRRRR